MKRNCKRFLRSLPVLALALCLVLADLTPAAAVTQADIDALKSDAKDLAQEKKEIQAQIDKLSADISNTLERKRLLDNQISLTEEEIANKEEEIQTYENLISQTAEELADAEAMNQIYGIGEVSAEALEAQSVRMRNNSKYVQGFENIATYVMDGENANSWLVYAVADINFYSARTRAPMILWCYVTVDGEGNYHIIDSRELSPKAQQLVNEANHSQEVRRLAADVNRRLKEALTSDENLNNVYGVLHDGSPVWEGTGEMEPEVVIVGETEGESR